MRRDVDGAQIGDMIGGVIGLVFAYRDASAALLGFGLEHGLRSVALSGAVGERDHAGHRQPMLVLHGGVAHVAELRLPRIASNIAKLPDFLRRKGCRAPPSSRR